MSGINWLPIWELFRHAPDTVMRDCEGELIKAAAGIPAWGLSHETKDLLDYLRCVRFYADFGNFKAGESYAVLEINFYSSKIKGFVFKNGAAVLAKETSFEVKPCER
jgi:hypothetical protein